MHPSDTLHDNTIHYIKTRTNVSQVLVFPIHAMKYAVVFLVCAFLVAIAFARPDSEDDNDDDCLVRKMGKIAKGMAKIVESGVQSFQKALENALKSIQRKMDSGNSE